MTEPQENSLEISTAKVFEPLLGDAGYKGAHGGRGSGKSWFFAEMMIESHIQRKTDSVVLREVWKDLKFSASKLLGETILRLNAGLYFDVQDKVIRVKHGGIIIFHGMQDYNADSIKSLEGFDRAWFEEAQNASQRSLDLLRPTVMRKPGAQLWFSWNRYKAKDPIELLFYGKHPLPNSVVVEANLLDNPFRSKELVTEMEADRLIHDADKFSNIWMGTYLQNTDGDYYKQEMKLARASGRICKIPRLDIPVNTFWDIGNSDGCAIWFHQSVGLEDRFIGYYENNGETLAHYVRKLQDTGYIFGKHFLPHDASHERLSINNKSVRVMLEDSGLKNVVVVPRIQYLHLGIQMVKKHFPAIYFDEDACAEGIERLDNYRKKYSMRDAKFLDEPDKSNGSSEAADALRQYAQARETGLITLPYYMDEAEDEYEEKDTGRSAISGY